MRYPICFLMILAACHSRPEIELEIPFTPVKVKTATVSAKRVSDNLTFTGVVVDRGREVKSGIAGRVEQIYVRNGDMVSEGDTLLSLRNDEIRIAAALAAASYERIRLDFESERLGYDTDQSDTLVQALEYISGLKEAQLNMQMASVRYARMFVIAPVSGVISGLEVVSGTQVDAGQRLAEIIPGTGGVFRTYFLENEWAYYRKGMGGSVRLADGRITRVVLEDRTPEIDDKGRFETFWRIMGEQFFPPGMGGVVQPESDMRQSIIVPASAVGGNGKDPVIFSVVNDTARWNSVELKWYNEDSVEVVEGLESGMKIILSGQAAVHDGTPVSEYSENYDHGNSLSVTVSNLP